MNIHCVIEQSLDVFYENQQADDEQIFYSLKQKGWDEITCSKIIAFVPIAFCRLLLHSSGVSFSEYYIIMQSDTKVKQKKRLDSEPFFKIAFNIAILKSKACDQNYFMSVATRSSEFNVVNSALNRGSILEDLILTPLVVFL